MSRDDYLFDPQARPDPGLQRLERAMAPLRLPAADVPERVLSAAASSGPTRRWPWLLLPALAAAAALVLWLGSGDGLLRPGSAPRTFVAAKAAVTIPLGELAELTLQPDGELQFVHWRTDQARFRLVRGSLDVLVVPTVAAGFFVVDTARATVVDQGCRYVLTVAADGSASVRVTEGAVTFAGVAAGGREVFVPAGASAAVDGDGGVGTPIFVGSSSDLRFVVRLYDRLLAGDDVQRRRDAARKLAQVCERAPDTLPLWHLLRDPDPDVQKTATGALLQVVGAPDGGTKSSGSLTAEQWLEFLRVAAWQRGG